MDQPPDLTRDGFDNLLAHLDADRHIAGQKYEQLRRRLVKFFDWHRSGSSDDLADRTIDRVVRNIEGGKTIYAEKTSSYFYGVARNVLREHWGEQKRQFVAIRRGSPGERPVSETTGWPWDESDLERRLACLDQCLGSLSDEDRELIVDYYRGETDVKIANRKALAERVGLGINALRIRSHRLRLKLESCLRDCMGRFEVK